MFTLSPVFVVILIVVLIAAVAIFALRRRNKPTLEKPTEINPNVPSENPEANIVFNCTGVRTRTQHPVAPSSSHYDAMRD